jgi:hypothetical protein
MKRLFVPLFAIALVAGLLGACTEPQPQPKPTHKPGGFHTPPPPPVNPDNGTSDETAPPKKSVPDDSQTKPTNPVPDNGPPVQQGNLPYAHPVPGKPGFVTSPYGGAGLIDARGFPPGTEVKDPYSGKSFLVP